MKVDERRRRSEKGGVRIEEGGDGQAALMHCVVAMRCRSCP